MDVDYPNLPYYLPANSRLGPRPRRSIASWAYNEEWEPFQRKLNEIGATSSHAFWALIKALPKMSEREISKLFGDELGTRYSRARQTRMED